MSQYAPPQNYTSPPPPSSGGSGLAITSMVCGIVAIIASCGVGVLASPIALVAIVLGIIALVRTTPDGRKPGKGFAIAGLSTGAVALLLGIAMLGILLPALAKARQSARILKSSTQMRNITQALQIYANSNGDAFPESDKDWSDRLLKAGSISTELLVAPDATPGMQSYFYVPGHKSTFSATKIILYENPRLRDSGGNIAFEDGHVEFYPRAEFDRLVGTIKTPDGKRYAPHEGQ